MSASSEQFEQMERERDHRIHQQNLGSQGEDENNKAEILRQLSEIDDLPIDPEEDQVMGQLISTLTSTANLTPEEVRSNEWVRQYILVLYLCKNPHPDGLHTHLRAWAHDDRAAYLEPLRPEKRMMIETFVSTSILALTRSEGFKAVEESTRTVNESVMRDETKEQNSGGLLARLRS